MSQSTYPFTIDALARNQDGYWTATLTVYGQSAAVDRTLGTWRVTPPDESAWQELLPRYAKALQEQVRKLERAERRDVADT